MGKMLGSGISGSALPFRRKAPAWTTMSPSNITELIVKNAKKGLTPSQIGVLMRDVYGIPQVSSGLHSLFSREYSFYIQK